jgi:hypothetical protein
MPLNDAAAQAVAESFLADVPAGANKTLQVAEFKKLVNAIFTGIKNNATVTVAPGSFAAGSDPVTGSGSGTIT